MKILLVHRYIRPDTPGYAHMLYIMGKRFAAQGHEVTIFSTQPSYHDAYEGPPLPRRQQVDGMTIIRTPLLKESKRNTFLRALNFLIFGLSVFMHAVFRGKAYDLMTVSTLPPTFMGFVARVIGLFRRTRYIYHCMDLYPEVALVSGLIKMKWVSKFAAAVDRRNCKKAIAVVVLSTDMLDTIHKRGLPDTNVYVINNFVINSLDPEAQVPEFFKQTQDKFRVLFAGNIGRFQSLDTIVSAAQLLGSNQDIEFWFVGSGVMVDSLKEQSQDLLGKTIFFHPHLPIETVMSVIAQAHLGIVSLSPGIIECAYPSKTMSYLEAGCKLLVMVEKDADIARFVKAEKIGVSTSEPKPEIVAQAIESEFQKWKESRYDRERIREVGRANFSQDVILDRWVGLLAELESRMS